KDGRVLQGMSARALIVAALIGAVPAAEAAGLHFPNGVPGRQARETGALQAQSQPRPGVGPADRPAVNADAADRGRHIWAVECITCHGAQARGTDDGPNLIRSMI